MKRSYLPVVAVAAALVVAAAGCSSSGTAKGGSSPSGTSSSSGVPTSSSSATAGALSGAITVYAASSLTGAFDTIKTAFVAAHPGTSVSFSFGSSGDLSTQITQGAAADVFASASPKNMELVEKAGDATSSTNFAANSLEIAVPPSNPGQVRSLQDLAKPSVKVAVCVATAPCGSVAAKVFAKAKITVKPRSNPPDVKTTLATVESGEVDAGCVYVTDVLAAGSKVKGIPIPASLNASTEYPIAALTHAKNSALAHAFVAYVLSPAGIKVLSAAGFSSP